MTLIFYPTIRFKRIVKGGGVMKERKQPDPVKILSTLYELYADQMGVKIKFEIVDKEATKSA